MSISNMVHAAYFGVEALEALLVAKGIIESGEVELWSEKLDKERTKESAIGKKEFWDRMEKGDLISFRHFHRPQEGRLAAKSEMPFGPITIIAIARNRWGKKKERE